MLLHLIRENEDNRNRILSGMFDLIPDLSSSSAVRKFLLQFAKELIDVDHTIFLPYLLNAIYFFFDQQFN